MPYYITDDADDCSGWAVVKDDGEQIGCHQTKQDAIDQMVAVSIAEGIEPGGERDVRAPAPPEDQIEGSDKNKPGSASGAGGDIKLSDETEKALRNKAKEHNDKMREDGKPDWSRTTYGQLAAVYRRGAGAYSTSHRPGVSRGAWAMARVNAYLYLLRNGKPENSKYVTDNDLLPEGHPRSTRSMEDRAVNLKVPAYIRAAARQGLKFHEEGKSGSGLRPKTVREAREMAAGNITENKVIRANAWGARHEPDLRADGAKPGQDGYPTPGAVAHLLWGIPTGDGYDAARSWFARKAEQIRNDRKMEVPPVAPRSNDRVQFRSITTELRADAETNTFVGYAAMFNSDSQPLPFVERIAPGAFRRSLDNRKRDIRLYVNHNSDLVLASKRSGTLRLQEDDRGLRVEAELPNTTYANDLRALMDSGVVDKMSFGFSVPNGGDEWSADGSERVLRSVTLHEVSVVTGFPAYEATTAAVRSLEHLAERTGLEVDDLTDTLDLLADGEKVDPKRAAALIEVLQQSMAEDKPSPDAVAMKAMSLALAAKKVI